MKTIMLGPAFTIFLLFFGVAALDAFQTGNWLRSAFWLAVALVFLMWDNKRRAN